MIGFFSDFLRPVQLVYTQNTPGESNLTSLGMLGFIAYHNSYSNLINYLRTSHISPHGRGVFSCILDERHLYSAIRCVENNPEGLK